MAPRSRPLSNRPKGTTKTPEAESEKRKNLAIPYVAGLSEKFRRLFQRHKIRGKFKLGLTLRQTLVDPKDETPCYKFTNVVFAAQCTEARSDLYIKETKQPLHKCMAQQRRTSVGQNSAVNLHFKDKGHSFEESNVHALDKFCGLPPSTLG